MEAGLTAAERDLDNWRATFHNAAAAALLYLSDETDEEAVARVREVLESRPSDVRSLFEIVERDELDRLGADPRAALALTPNPGTTLSSSTGAPALEAARGGNHGHLPELPRMLTGFVGWGAGLRKGVAVDRMGLADIAAIVTRLLDLQLETPDGAVPEGILGE